MASPSAVTVENMLHQKSIDIKKLHGIMPEWFVECLDGLDKADMDTADGTLDKEEMEDVLKMAAAQKKAKKDNSDEIDYSNFPEKVKKVMKTWDADAGGTVSVAELSAAAKAQDQMEAANKFLKVLIGIVVLTIIFLCVTMFGASYASNELAKESRPSDDGIAKIAGSDKPMAMATAGESAKLADIYDEAKFTLEGLKSITSVGFTTASGGHVYEIVGVSRLETDGVMVTSLFTASGHTIAVTKASAMLIYPEKSKEPVLERRMAAYAPRFEPIYLSHPKGRRLAAGDMAKLKMKTTAKDSEESTGPGEYIAPTEEDCITTQSKLCADASGYLFCSTPGKACPGCEDDCMGDKKCIANCKYDGCLDSCGDERALQMTDDSYGGYDGYDFAGFGSDGYDGYAGFAGPPGFASPEMCKRDCDTRHCSGVCETIPSFYERDECHRVCGMISAHVDHYCYNSCVGNRNCIIDCMHEGCVDTCPEPEPMMDEEGPSGEMMGEEMGPGRMLQRGEGPGSGSGRGSGPGSGPGSGSGAGSGPGSGSVDMASVVSSGSTCKDQCDMESCYAGCHAFQRSSEECMQQCTDGITPDYAMAGQNMFYGSDSDSPYMGYDGYWDHDAYWGYDASYGYGGYMAYGGYGN